MAAKIKTLINGQENWNNEIENKIFRIILNIENEQRFTFTD
jgi:hypothetical protein